MSDSNPDLLPVNATPLERELARLSAALDAVEAGEIEKIWDAWRCPAVLLPWLAWALSLDAWDDGWSEETKRQAIADSPLHHRRKGTRASIETVLRLFGCRTSILEWWQQQPPGRRGTSRLTAYVFENREPNSPPITPELVAKVRAAVYATKPKSRSVEVRFGIAAGAEIGAVTAAQGAQASWVAASAGRPRPDGPQIGIVAAARRMQLTYAAAGGARPRPSSTIAMLAASRGMQILSISVDARQRTTP